MTGVFNPTIVMGLLGLVFGALLAYASIKFFVPMDPRVAEIRTLLPGANCGGCGYPGCDGYAHGVVTEGAKTNLCAAGGAPLAAAIADVMGVASEGSMPKIAYLKCLGTPEVSERTNVYQGIADCRSAAILPGGGPNACPFGCIGLGTCVDVCAFGAMSVVNGLATVDRNRCVGCGTCVNMCPKGVLTLIPTGAAVEVTCNSQWRGPDVKRVCKAGCIGCGLCVRACPSEAIALVNNLARIDHDKCTACGACEAKCPVKCIVPLAPEAVDEKAV